MRSVRNSLSRILGTLCLLVFLGFSVGSQINAANAADDAVKLVDLAANICAKGSGTAGQPTSITLKAPPKTKVTAYVKSFTPGNPDGKQQVVGEATTDDEGNATISYTLPAVGTYMFAATYKGPLIGGNKDALNINWVDLNYCEGTGGSDRMDATAPVSTGSDTAARSVVYADPFGFTFDVDNGEPIADVRVTVMDKDGNVAGSDLVIPKNPADSDTYGQFNFFVKPGTYILDAKKSGYEFPLTEKQLRSAGAYNSASNNICGDVEQLNALTLGNYHALYSDSSQVVVKDKVVHTDIPLKSVGSITTPTKPKIYYAFLVPNGQFNEYILYLQVSHPNTTINVLHKGKLIKSTKAGCYGMVAIEVPLNPDFVGKDEIQIQARKNSSVAIGAQKVFADDTASVSDTYKVSVDPAVFTDISVVDNQGQAQTGYLVQARSSLSGAVLNQAEVKDGKFSLRGISQPYKLELISESDGKATPISVDESKRVVVGSSSLETSDVVSSATDATPINSSNIPSAVWIWVLVIIAILFLGALTFILVAKHKASKD